MKGSTIRMRIKAQDGKIWLRALISHPMETGLRKDKITGLPVPAHFINEVTVAANGRTVFTADWSTSIAENPYLFIRFDGSAGDRVRLTWRDNQGNSDFIEKTVGKR